MLDLLAGLDAPQDAPDDPAAAYRDARTRRAAWEAWLASGADIDHLPGGFVSASLSACMKRPGKPGPKWGRR